MSNTQRIMSKPKALNLEKLRAFVLPIEQDRPRGDPVKTEYGKGQGTALVEPDEEAVELRSVTPVMAAKHSAAFLWDRPVNGSAKSRKD